MSATEERLVGADRVIAVLTELAEHPLGVTLDELAGILHSSKPTVHRALATLRRAGLADLMGRGVYVLGDEFVRLALRNLDGRPETIRIQPLLEELAEVTGETAHYAILAGTEIVYRAKADPPHGAVRLTSVVGGRNPAHSTSVGKALLGERAHSVAELTDYLGPGPLEARTPNTITGLPELVADLEATARRGYAIDDEENELGITCVAVPVFTDASPTPAGAISISAVTFRCSKEQLIGMVPTLRAMVSRHLGAGALGPGSTGPEAS
jgi:IclR family transcriptional regulator, acetate operon repressor